MKRLLILIIAALIIILATFGIFFRGDSLQTASNLGTYAYECDEHVAFEMTPASDLSSVTLKPISGSYPPAATLTKVPTNNGARFEGGGLVLVGHGESLVLGEGDNALNCSPAPSDTEAPFNFGD